MPNVQICTHIKVNGVRCGSPTLRGEQFCYFHQRLFRTVKSPDTRLHQIALLEDNESIQASVMEVVNGLVRGTLELKRAELILRALNTAVRNSRAVHFNIHAGDMVRQIPDYPTPPNTDSSPADDASHSAGPELPTVAATRITLRDATIPDIATMPIAPAATSAPAHSPAAQSVGHSSPNWKPGWSPDPARPKPPMSVSEKSPTAKHRKSATRR